MIDGGLKGEHRSAIIDVIAANDRVERAVLFGSRAMGTNTVTSDVDIALYGDSLTLTDQARLAGAIGDIPMAQSVELVLYDSIDNPAFREHIQTHGVEWYRRAKADRLDLLSKHRRVLEALLRKHLPDVEVWAYGSRVNGRSHDGSDLDLVLRGPGLKKIPIDCLAEFEEAVRESNIPFLVEARDWARLPESFHREIERDHVVLAGCEQWSEIHYWRDTTLGDVTEFLSGGTPSKGQPAYWNGSTPWVSAKDMKRFRLHDTVDHVTAEGLANGTRKVPAGSVLLLTRGMTLLNELPVCVAEKPMAFNQDVKALRPKPAVDPGFLPYLLLGNKGRLLSLVDLAGHGTGRINSDELESLDIRLPPPSEQRAIAQVLATLDDRIELNRRMNETLEAIVRALFKSWFIDFDPVRAKMEGRDMGLPKHIADLFPDRLVNSEIGEIPEGWEIGCLAGIASFPRRGVDPADLRAGTPYIGLEHMPRGSIALAEWEDSEKITSNKSVFKKGEFLFGKLRPYFHKVGLAPISGVCSTDIIVVAPKSAKWSAFVLSVVSSVDFVMYTDQTSTGTRMPRTSWTTMSRYALCLPPEPVAQAFQNAAEPLLNQVITNTHGNRTLASARDVLLPQLVAGEIRLKNAERALEAVV